MYQVGEYSGWCCSSKPGHIAWQAPPWRLRRGVGCSKMQGVEPGLQLRVVYASTQYCYLEGPRWNLDGGAGVAVTRRRTSAITLGSPVRTSTVPMSHFLFPHFKYGVVSIMRYKLGV